jgi:hypothetical protein
MPDIILKHLAVWMLAFAMLPLVARAQTHLNLADGHNLESILATGLKYKENNHGDKRRHFSLESQNIALTLPGGTTIQSKIDIGSITARNGKMIFLDITGGILPDDEAYQVALTVHKAFSIPVDRLNEWKDAIKGKGRDAPTFSNGQNGCYPNVFIEILSSMNTKYPWMIRMSFSWNVDDDDKRDETWGKTNNPKPPTGLAQVSLDSPTGKIYELKDAYANLIKEQEALDHRLGQVRDANGHLINPLPSAPKKVSKVKSTPPPSEERTSSPPLSSIVILIVAATGLLSFLVKNRK